MGNTCTIFKSVHLYLLSFAGTLSVIQLLFESHVDHMRVSRLPKARENLALQMDLLSHFILKKYPVYSHRSPYSVICLALCRESEINFRWKILLSEILWEITEAQLLRHAHSLTLNISGCKCRFFGSVWLTHIVLKLVQGFALLCWAERIVRSIVSVTKWLYEELIKDL